MTNPSDALRVVVDRCNARRSHFPANLPPHPCSFYMDCADWDLMHAALAQALEDSARLEFVLRRMQGGQLRALVGALSDTSDLSEFRTAIDSAIAAQQKEADGG